MKLLLANFLIATLPLSATVVISYAENPMANQSSMGGVSVFDFNNLSTGLKNNVSWNGVGTLDRMFVSAPTIWGGAADSANPTGSNYLMVGEGVNVKSTTLQLSNNSAYFGLWWSAGDPRNQLAFYNGLNLVAQFTTSSIMSQLPASYNGNPLNRGMNMGEKYAYLNFFGDENTSWDRVVMTNAGYSGFEIDNLASRVAGWNPSTDDTLPGIVVAEVNGTNTTPTNKENLTSSRWSLSKSTVAQAPGAPAPPWILLACFGAVVVFRSYRKTTTA